MEDIREILRQEIARALESLARERGVACLLASHDPLVIGRADVVFRLEDGRLAATERRP